ncbi:MAG: hypothetical protein C4326_06045 [Ignavibacteria bacterium]
MSKPTAIEKLFTRDDIKRIENAVHQAEKETSGEIVPYVVYTSDAYEHALWRAGATFGALGFFGFLVLHSVTELAWKPVVAAELGLATCAGAIIGALIAADVPAVKRFFAGKKMLEQRVRQRAMEAFLAEEVFKTRERTGILIFLSLLEHKVLVLSDSGINAKVQQADWEGIVATIVDGMRLGKPADALIRAIQQCGELLKKHGVARRADDADELSDSLRTR